MFLGADPPDIVKNKSFTFTAHAPQPILQQQEPGKGSEQETIADSASDDIARHRNSSGERTGEKNVITKGNEQNPQVGAARPPCRQAPVVSGFYA
jgi:hypothetical protein